MPEVTLVAAFVAGLLSFLSPCVLPLIPAYISFIAGLSIEELTAEGKKPILMLDVTLNSLFFVLGSGFRMWLERIYSTAFSRKALQRKKRKVRKVL